MDRLNKEIDEAQWRRAEKFITQILIDDDYDQCSAEQLGFCIAQILVDAKPLLDAVETSTDPANHDHEKILEQMHMLFNNHRLFSDGNRILMRESFEMREN